MLSKPTDPNPEQFQSPIKFVLACWKIKLNWAYQQHKRMFAEKNTGGAAGAQQDVDAALLAELEKVLVITICDKNNDACAMRTIAKKLQEFQAIQLRPLSNAERPKLIIGCGNYSPEGGSFNNPVWRTLHSHADADTIDQFLSRNPTVVGTFGANLPREYVGSSCCHPNDHIFPSNHYQIILDEGPMSKYTHKTWHTIDRILKPGGIFIATFYPWLAHEPICADSSLRLHKQPLTLNYNGRTENAGEFLDESPRRGAPVHPWWREFLNNKTGRFMVTKPFADGTHPTEIPEEDIPEGHRPCDTQSPWGF